MKKLKKVETEQEKFLNKIFHFTFCYQPGMERQEFEIYFKHIPILIEQLNHYYDKYLKNEI